MIIMVVAVYVLLIVYEFVPLYKQKLYKDLIVNGILSSLSMLAAILLSLDINIPSPAKPIEAAVIWILGR